MCYYSDLEVLKMITTTIQYGLLGLTLSFIFSSASIMAARHQKPLQRNGGVACTRECGHYGHTLQGRTPITLYY